MKIKKENEERIFRKDKENEIETKEYLNRETEKKAEKSREVE